MNGTDKALLERQRYVGAFNDTMVKIWKERIILTKAIDTGDLYASVAVIGMTADEKYTEVTLEQSFNIYGIYVDYGVGRNTPRGNKGRNELGQLENGNERKRKIWFSKKHYSSTMNLAEFYQENMSDEITQIISNALTRKIATRFVL